jgi:hypothetical protein
MPKLITQEEFIARCRKMHGDKYDYSGTIYLAAKKKITVCCPKHGRFDTIAGNHASGIGCPKCGRERTESAKRSSTQAFIERARRIHGTTYDYSKVNYQRNSITVLLGCPTHGWFNQTPAHHLAGGGCKKCGTQRTVASLRAARGLSRGDYFQQCENAHGGRYKYPDQPFNGMRGKISAICPIHGLFQIDAVPHLRLKTGCQKCGYSSTSAAKKRGVTGWLEQVRKIHGVRYEYDTSNWNGVMSKVRIRCPKHGWWQQQALKHAQGQICPKCANERLSGRWQPETMTAEYAAEPCFFYYLHLSTDDEAFYKIGISNYVASRCSRLRQSGYKVRVIHKISGTRKSCLELEIATFKEFDDFAAYVPRQVFAGDGECFSWDILGMDI